MIKVVLFDLDGTLLGLDNDSFGRPYIASLHKAVFEELGYDVKTTYKMVFGAIGMMVNNPNPLLSNVDQFYAILEKMIAPNDLNKTIEKINAFYLSPLYDMLEKTVAKRNEMIEAVRILKEKGYKVAVCTNPIFPRLAISKRLNWAGFNESDFEFVTFGEETHSLKPNLSYYQEAINTHFKDVSYEEIMMVGNDVEEDMIVEKLGLKTYLVKDYLISRCNRENEIENSGNGLDFLKFVKEKM